MSRRILLVSLTLLASFGLRLWLSADPIELKREALSTFPRQAGAWKMERQDVLDDETAKVLKADDYLLRGYRDGTGQQADVFIAYYESQKAGESMHSPNNCLPGAGWAIAKSDLVALETKGASSPVMINRYLIEKNADKALVLYWYQAGGRVIASEYWGKIYLVWDALRTGRRDGAIVRFVVPLRKSSDGEMELQAALNIARETFPHLSKFLPN